MKTFTCHCGNTLYFENTRCLKCERRVAFLPDRREIGALDPVDGAPETWRAPGHDGRYRLCRNYTVQDVCNWVIPLPSDDVLCPSCRLDQVIPNLDKPRNRKLWYTMERAKRRLLYTLMRFDLPIVGRERDPERGLAFQFLEDEPPSNDAGHTTARVLTGHQRGLITINLAEADPSERERMKESMGERYRTVLGHFRHESGHYYWDRLIRDGTPLEPFRALFGDERADYDEALRTHYRDGPVQGWPDRFISAYASSHPWEDWAETWAHYLHMVDALETAATYGFALRGRPIRSPRGPSGRRTGSLSWYSPRVEFDSFMDDWMQLSTALNAMNRSMGQTDIYPFVITPAVAEKLRFVHELIHSAREKPAAV